MGAEGKFDLALAPSHDPDKLRYTKLDIGATGSSKNKSVGASLSEKIKVILCKTHSFNLARDGVLRNLLLAQTSEGYSTELLKSPSFMRIMILKYFALKHKVIDIATLMLVVLAAYGSYSCNLK